MYSEFFKKHYYFSNLRGYVVWAIILMIEKIIS